MLRAVSHGAAKPDPIASIMCRSAASNYAHATVVVPPSFGDNPNLTDKCNGEESEGKNLTADWAHKSETALRIKNMIETVRSIGYMQSAAEEYDMHSYLLNALNGTLDLGNGSLRPAERND